MLNPTPTQSPKKGAMGKNSSITRYDYTKVRKETTICFIPFDSRPDTRAHITRIFEIIVVKSTTMVGTEHEQTQNKGL